MSQRHRDGTHAVVALVRRDGATIATWPLRGVRCADLAVVDELARLRVRAARLGYRLHVRDACADLAELLDLVAIGLVVEVRRETEDGEEPGVEEVVVSDDPVA